MVTLMPVNARVGVSLQLSEPPWPIWSIYFLGGRGGGGLTQGWAASAVKGPPTLSLKAVREFSNYCEPLEQIICGIMWVLAARHVNDTLIWFSPKHLTRCTRVFVFFIAYPCQAMDKFADKIANRLAMPRPGGASGTKYCPALKRLFFYSN